MIWEDPDGDGAYTLNTPTLPAGVLDSFFNAVEVVDSAARGEQVVAVGCGFDGQTGDLVALFYDNAGGLRRLSDVLVNENGIDLQGHTLTDATGLRRRPDAIHICGNGVNSGGGDEGWYAEIALGAVPCPGDLDGDGQVSLADLAILLSNFGTVGGATPEQGDLDGDGDVDLADLALMLGVFGTACA